MRHILAVAIASLALSGPALAQDVSRVHGGDTYAAGEAVTQSLTATGDVFAAGSVITTSGSAAGDMHAAGYDVNISAQTGGDLYAAIAALPTPQRAALALFYTEGLSVAEVAVALDIPLGTVKTRLMNARARLRAHLTGDQDGQS